MYFLSRPNGLDKKPNILKLKKPMLCALNIKITIAHGGPWQRKKNETVKKEYALHSKINEIMSTFFDSYRKNII